LSILAWIALGLVVGLVAGWLWGSRGRALGGDATAGVLGAVLGGFMASVTLGLNVVDLDFTSLVVAGVGAAMLILLVHAVAPADVFT
jgi:uncharacterized membrane protein YeaQ/YmgE (transglycosylase-associated protein family)